MATSLVTGDLFNYPGLLGTQISWKVSAKLSDVETALRKMINLAELFIETAGKSYPYKIGLPKIGAGLGGLPWQSVKDLLIRLGQSTPIELIVFEEYIPAIRSHT
jgi:hypothetical protein